MAVRKTKKKGRPKISIDWEEFKKLCSIQCTLAEIAAWFKCSEDTIERRCTEEKGMLFADYFKKNAVSGKISLRRTQFKSAVDGNVTMLIWMGKQFLGQTEKSESKTELYGKDGGKIEVSQEMTADEATRAYLDALK